MRGIRAGLAGLLLAFGLGGGLLLGCAAEESTAAGDGPGEGTGAKTGRAEIRLPAIPPGFLAKRAQGEVGSAGAAVDSPDVAFILTVSGPGMVTRKQAWNLAVDGGTVSVEKIPVGLRTFKGELEVNGHITHEDSAHVEILGGRTAQVNLKLVSNRGDAVVCVEIDGLPPPPGCVGGPGGGGLPGGLRNLGGCYRFDITGHGFATSASLRIDQKDTLLTGVITWPDGGADSSRGRVLRDGSLSFGNTGLAAGFHLTGWYDTLFQEFRGSDFLAPGRQLSGFYAALRSDCPSGPDPVDSSYYCYAVSQTFENNARYEGSLVVQEIALRAHGVFAWDGVSLMPVSGAISYSNGETTWNLGGILPPGLYDHPSHPSNAMRYLVRRGGFSPRALYGGAVYWNPDILGYPVGSWKGESRACGNEDVARVRAHHPVVMF